DSDQSDLVVETHPASASGSWSNTGQAADTVKMADHYAVFITPEAAQGNSPGTDLNVDGDKLDRVLQIYDASSNTPLPCSGAGCNGAGVKVAADEFVVGDFTTACGGRQLVAFRTDTDQMMIYDLVQHQLKNTGMTVVPCTIPECDPRFPYKVEG